MRHLLRNLLRTLAVLGALGAGTSVASAQGYGVRIGEPSYEPGYERVERRVYREERPVYRGGDFEERRVYRRPVQARTVCRTVVRERTNPYTGVTVRRPVEVCRRVVGGRRVFVE